MAGSAILKPPSTIKPDDLVRTMDGGTHLVVEIRPAGYRLIEEVRTGERSVVHAGDLYLVRSALPRPWREHLP